MLGTVCLNEFNASLELDFVFQLSNDQPSFVFYFIFTQIAKIQKPWQSHLKAGLMRMSWVGQHKVRLVKTKEFFYLIIHESC